MWHPSMEFCTCIHSIHLLLCVLRTVHLVREAGFNSVCGILGKRPFFKLDFISTKPRGSFTSIGPRKVQDLETSKILVQGHWTIVIACLFFVTYFFLSIHPSYTVRTEYSNTSFSTRVVFWRSRFHVWWSWMRTYTMYTRNAWELNLLMVATKRTLQK